VSHPTVKDLSAKSSKGPKLTHAKSKEEILVGMDKVDSKIAHLEKCLREMQESKRKAKKKAKKDALVAEAAAEEEKLLATTKEASETTDEEREMGGTPLDSSKEEEVVPEPSAKESKEEEAEEEIIIVTPLVKLKKSKEEILEDATRQAEEVDALAKIDAMEIELTAELLEGLEAQASAAHQLKSAPVAGVDWDECEFMHSLLRSCPRKELVLSICAENQARVLKAEATLPDFANSGVLRTADGNSTAGNPSSQVRNKPTLP
jgi:hypothetical protein